MAIRHNLPKFAQEMQRWGKYAFENQGAIYEEIERATNLTDEEKLAARKGLEDIIASRTVFRKIWLDSQKPV